MAKFSKKLFRIEGWVKYLILFLVIFAIGYVLIKWIKFREGAESTNCDIIMANNALFPTDTTDTKDLGISIALSARDVPNCSVNVTKVIDFIYKNVKEPKQQNYENVFKEWINGTLVQPSPNYGGSPTNTGGITNDPVLKDIVYEKTSLKLPAAIIMITDNLIRERLERNNVPSSDDE